MNMPKSKEPPGCGSRSRLSKFPKKGTKTVLKTPVRILRGAWRVCQLSLLIAFGVVCFRAGFEAHNNDFTRPVFELVFGIEDSPKSTLLRLFFVDSEGTSEETKKSPQKEGR
jgi:hypothetical protein